MSSDLYDERLLMLLSQFEGHLRYAVSSVIKQDTPRLSSHEYEDAKLKEKGDFTGLSSCIDDIIEHLAQQDDTIPHRIDHLVDCFDKNAFVVNWLYSRQELDHDDMMNHYWNATWIAEELSKAGRIQKAVLYLKAFEDEERLPDSQKTPTNLAIAMSYLQLGAFQKAKPYLQKLKEHPQHKSQANYVLAMITIQQASKSKDYDTLMRGSHFLDQAKQSGVQEYLINAQQGFIFHLIGDSQKAEEAYTRALVGITESLGRKWDEDAFRQGVKVSRILNKLTPKRYRLLVGSALIRDFAEEARQKGYFRR